MRAVFAEAAKDERASIADGTFDNTGVPSGWADLIVIATARMFRADLINDSRG